MTDQFDQTREKIWGTPGFQSRRSTVTHPAFLGQPQGDWIIETVRNDETWVVFLRFIGAEGSQRLVLPGKVVESIFRHRESIVKKARSERAKRAAKKSKFCQIHELSFFSSCPECEKGKC